MKVTHACSMTRRVKGMRVASFHAFHLCMLTRLPAFCAHCATPAVSSTNCVGFWGVVITGWQLLGGNKHNSRRLTPCHHVSSYSNPDILSIAHVCSGREGEVRERGQPAYDSREKGKGIAEIPRGTDKAVSFMEDVVCMLVCCGTTLAFLPIPCSPRGRARPAGGSV